MFASGAGRTNGVPPPLFGELFYLLNCRSLIHSMFTLGLFSNPWLFAGVITMGASQLLSACSLAMQQVSGTANLGIEEWMPIKMAGVVVFVVVEIEKNVTMSSDIR